SSHPSCPPSHPPPFPYTTLFRSRAEAHQPVPRDAHPAVLRGGGVRIHRHPAQTEADVAHLEGAGGPGASHAPRDGTQDARGAERSEEHTSELQSHLNLVCRLLLE